MSVLDELARVEEADEIATRIAYLSLVKQLAAGEDDPTLEQVQQILAAADMTTSDLRRDVQKHQSRGELRAHIAAAGEAKRRQDQFNEELGVIGSELQAATDRYNAKLASFSSESIEVVRLINLGNESARQLRDLCDDPVLKEKLAENRRKLQQVESAVDDWKERVSAIQAKIHAEEARGESRSANGGGPGADSAKLISLRARLGETKKQLEAFRAKMAPLLAEQRRLLEAKENF